VKIPLSYNARSLLQRPISTAFTALGIGLVVAVFIGMLALANGFRSALSRTGSDDNVLVLRRGADSELASGITREMASIISALPHVATAADGRPLVSPEVYVLVPLPRLGADTNALANVVARGISDKAWEVRANVLVTNGQRPTSGRAEICVGEKLVGRFGGTGIGEQLRFAGRDWDVVCHFSAGGSAFESEIWGENEQFMPVFRGEVFQSLSFRLSDPAAFEDAERALEGDRRVQVDAYRESEFYIQQSVLLTLGFQPRSVLASFLVESAIIAAIGGVIGCLIALPVNGLVASTTNWASFSEIAFSFRVTPGLLLAGFTFAVVMGVVGGFFPARRAAMMPVVQALR
jgi:ABC-type lipoprotein release transport system permease subunit